MKFLQKYRGKRVCVAVSGGADSMCLLQIFYENAAAYSITLSAVTCEHGIRGESSLRDVEFVKNVCAERNIPLAVFSADIPQRAKNSGRGLEEEGRAFRYECFDKILSEGKTDLVATAHHKGDLAETVLFRLARGTSLSGIAAIKENGVVVRPLLNVTKEEILNYLAARGMAYITDETNGDERFSRNAIRKNVVPALEKIVAGAEEHIADFARRAGEDDEYLQSLAKAATRREQGEIFIPANLPRPIFLRAAVGAICSLGGRNYGEGTLCEIEKLKGLQSGKKVCFCGVVAVKEGEEIAFYKPAEEPFGELAFQAGTHGAGAYIIEIGTEKRRGALYADMDKFPDGCVIRTRRTGDTFTPFGGKEKPLKKFLTDKKIPSRKSAALPLIAKGATVYAVLGVEISELVKVTEDTKNTVYLTARRTE